MVIFLVLGYCPVRNALCSFTNHHGQTKEQKAPRDIKAIVEDACNAYNSGDKVIPYQEATSKTTVSLLLAVAVAVVFFACINLFKNVTVLYANRAPRGLNSIPLYLVNKALLI